MRTDRLDDANTSDTEADAAEDEAPDNADELGDDDELDDDDEPDDDDTDSLFLDEDEGAPNLVPEEHPRRVLAGRIEILDKIGEGGMGSVWRGLHLKLERIVAVKLLDETLKLRSDARERFIREARVLALLVHRNVVTIHDCDELPDGRLYLCMELLEGETLRDIIKRRKPLDALEVIDAGMQVCDAVQAAHDRGVLHRDLTPSNIIRLGDDAKTIKVIDWGLCKYLDLFYVRSTQKYGAPPGARLVTPIGCRFGNPEYMAPEMILRNNPGPPSFCTDVYALAVVLYELLTGRHPFVSGDRKLPRPVRDFLPDFDYHDLEGALRAALRYRPEERTPTMAELREGLELARACLLAQRGVVPAPELPEEAAPAAAHTPAPAVLHATARPIAPAAPATPQAPTAEGKASDEPLVATGDCAARHEAPPALARVVPLRPRGRLVPAVLAAVLGLVAGVGGTLAMRAGEHVQAAADQPLTARIELERARADAAELRANRCEAEATPPAPAPDPPATTPPDQPPTPAPGQPPALAPDRPAAPVLAASRGVRRPMSTKTPNAMARLAPKIRACARKGGIPEGPITVQVRRQAGVIDSVKLLEGPSVRPLHRQGDPPGRPTAEQSPSRGPHVSQVGAAMLAILVLPLLLAPPDPPSPEELAAEGEAFLKAAEAAERPLDVLLSAHTSFDSAYLGGHDPGHLCRALDVTGLALQLPALTDVQERKFWEETQRDDLDRLRLDAEETKRDNCRFAGGPSTAPRIALIDPDGPSAVKRTEAVPHAGEGSTGSAMPLLRQAHVGRAEMRRQRAYTTAGAVLTTAGLGLFGVLAGVLTLERQRIDEMRGLVGTAKAEGRLFTVEEDRRFGELKGDVFRGAHAAIGVGAAGLVTLGTGVALLATRKKSKSRRYAFQPYGGPQGAGAVLRLKF